MIYSNIDIFAIGSFVSIATFIGMCVASVAEAEPAPGCVDIIAHRGASYERPEHTLAAYQLAMEQGADFIEPDLRFTKDGHFIALHDNTLNRTTDIADKPEFADRAHTDEKGQPYWLPQDFTLAELKTLRTRSGNKRPAAGYDLKYSIPALKEIVDLAREYNRTTGRNVGLAPELRGHPEEFVEFVKEVGLNSGPDPLPLFIQSFFFDELKAVKPHVQGDYAWLLSAWPEREKWEELKKHIDGFAFNKNIVLADDARQRIAEAHEFGFRINAWSFADDFCDRKRFDSPEHELAAAIENGVDSFFTDSPKTAFELRARLLKRSPIDFKGAAFEKLEDLEVSLANQGLVNDGRHMYEVMSDRIIKWRLSDWVEVARNEDKHLLWSGRSITSMGGGCFHDGFLYVGGGSYDENGKAMIFKIDPETLAAVEVYDIQEYTSYGINTVNFWDGYWYIGETSYDAKHHSIYMFDGSFRFVRKAFQSENPIKGFQDGDIYDDHLILSDHTGGYWIFARNPDFTLRHVYTIRTVATDSQGISFYKNSNLFYLADRRDSRIARLVVAESNSQ